MSSLGAIFAVVAQWKCDSFYQYPESPQILFHTALRCVNNQCGREMMKSNENASTTQSRKSIKRNSVEVMNEFWLVYSSFLNIYLFISLQAQLESTGEKKWRKAWIMNGNYIERFYWGLVMKLKMIFPRSYFSGKSRATWPCCVCSTFVLASWSKHIVFQGDTTIKCVPIIKLRFVLAVLTINYLVGERLIAG